MARTTAMRLVELMILKEDINRVIEYLGKRGSFEFQSDLGENVVQAGTNASREVFDKLQMVRTYLNIDDIYDYSKNAALPADTDFEESGKIFAATDDLRAKEMAALENQKKVGDAYTESLAFANLKVPYRELEHVSFLSLRIGKIDPAVFNDLQFSIGNRAVIVPLGEDKSRIMAASSKKARFALDSELKRFGFVPIEVAKDFKGIPDDVLETLKMQTVVAEKEVNAVIMERKNYAETHAARIQLLLQYFSIGMQVQSVRDKLEATQLVYRITGWIPAYESRSMMKELDELTEGRIAIREYEPEEVPSVQNGREKVPVKLKHGKLVSSFDRLVFSYGAPLYGTIDPTPMVAFFFTLLFGIMFGDLGQGLVFVLAGFVLHFGKIKALQGWKKFAPIFWAIGTSSSVMGILNGEFFANGELLIPVSRFITGLFGEPRDHILHLMPSSDSIDKLFMFFLFTLGVGFIINSVGLVINIINQFLLKRPGKALFGKTGLSGTLFFWYIVAMVARIVLLKSSIQWFDWTIIGITLFGVFFAHPLENLVSGHRPIFHNGIGVGIIEGLVEILEVLSSYLSNSVSFLRVGAFALAHAVLGFIIFSMTSLMGEGFSVGGIFIMIIGNVVVIVLEGMIVAIQVIRLQYYEFFSKFFTETGKEFIPFKFNYKENQ